MEPQLSVKGELDETLMRSAPDVLAFKLRTPTTSDGPRGATPPVAGNWPARAAVNMVYTFTARPHLPGPIQLVNRRPNYCLKELLTLLRGY